MREYTVTLEDIFTGLDPRRTGRKNVISLSECHNLEPVYGDYDLHEFVVDLDTDGYDWDNADTETVAAHDVWLDNDGDAWSNNDGDVWLDN